MGNALKRKHEAKVDPRVGQATRISRATRITGAKGETESRERFSPAPASPGAGPIELSAVELHQLAHDTRNWLTALQVYCDLLRVSIVDDCERWVMELSDAVERGQKIVASMLEAAQTAEGSADSPVVRRAASYEKVYGPNPVPRRERQEGGATAGTLSPPSFDAVAAIRRRLPLIERLAGSEIRIRVEAMSDDGMVCLPENDFDRILLNLVLNAIDAMPHGGQLRISLRAKANRHRTPSTRSEGMRGRGNGSRVAPPREKEVESLLLRVYDSGEGIAADFLPSIFEPGVSSKPERDSETGIHGYGLSSVRELVERAGGKVRVRSRLGHGSCFEVELPVANPGRTQLRSAC